jgi:hypothetical protein
VFTLITPYVHDNSFSAQKKYDHGFLVASVVFLNVLVNFILFARSTFMQLKVKLGDKVLALKEKLVSQFKNPEKVQKEPIEPMKISFGDHT